MIKELVVGQIVYKRVVIKFNKCTCITNCPYTYIKEYGVATLEVVEPGFIPEYEYGGRGWGPYNLNQSEKGRVRAAKVLSIVDEYHGNDHVTAYSIHQGSFKYSVGDTVRPTEPFSEENCACASGIHCFETFEQAENYAG